VLTTERTREQISFAIRCQSQNKRTDDAETTLSVSSYQILAAATGKARLPIVGGLKDGAIRWLVAEDRSVRRHDTSATWVSGPRYSVNTRIPSQRRWRTLHARCSGAWKGQVRGSVDPL